MIVVTEVNLILAGQ